MENTPLILSEPQIQEDEFEENDAEIEMIVNQNEMNPIDKPPNRNEIVITGTDTPEMPEELKLPPISEEERDPNAPLGSRMNPLGIFVRPANALERRIITKKKLKVPRSVLDYIENQDKVQKIQEAKYQELVNYTAKLQEVLDDLGVRMREACISRGKIASMTEDEALEKLAVVMEQLNDPAQKLEGLHGLISYLGLD